MSKSIHTLIIVFVSSFILVSCSSHRLDNGKYTMTLKLDTKEENRSKVVLLETEGKKVTIKSESDKETLNGTITGNELIIIQDIDNKKVEFLGKLIQDNTIEGNAKQTTNEEVKFTATFTLVKAAD